MELHVEVQLGAVVVQRRAVVHTDVFGPSVPVCAAEKFLNGHEQGKIIQPPEVFLAEDQILHILADVAALVSLVQQSQTVLGHQLVVHMGGVSAEVHGCALFFRQHALCDQIVQTDQVGIAGKSGVGLIGGVKRAVGACAQRQDLPVTLAGFFQKIHEIVCCLVETADAVLGGQAGDGQQDTCISVHCVVLLLYIDSCWNNATKSERVARASPVQGELVKIKDFDRRGCSNPSVSFADSSLYTREPFYVV